jgi:hypothetical protein
MNKKMEKKMWLFTLYICLGGIMLYFILGPDFMVSIISWLLVIIVFASFVIAAAFLINWEQDNIKKLAGIPWKVAIFYPVYILLILSFYFIGIKYFPGNHVANSAYFAGGIFFAILLGTIFLNEQRKTKLKKEEVWK